MLLERQRICQKNRICNMTGNGAREVVESTSRKLAVESLLELCASQAATVWANAAVCLSFHC